MLGNDANQVQEEEEEEHAHVSFADEVSEQRTQRGQPMWGKLSRMEYLFASQVEPKNGI